MEMDLLGYETGAPPPQRVTAGGRTMAFRESGYDNARVIVLLHGVSSLAASFGPQFVSLPYRGLRVIAWDAPGYGGSDPLEGDAPSPEDYAASLLALVDALKLGEFFLLGHSMGALPAAAFAKRHGRARVKKLVLASPTPGYASAPPELRRERVEGRLTNMAALGPAALAKKRGPEVLSAQAPKRALMLVQAVMREMHAAGYAQAVRMLGRGDIIAEGRAIAVPTLVLSGTADTVTPEAQCRRIAEAIPGARYESLSGAGHSCYIEAPGPFDDALMRFLDAP